MPMNGDTAASCAECNGGHVAIQPLARDAAEHGLPAQPRVPRLVQLQAHAPQAVHVREGRAVRAHAAVAAEERRQLADDLLPHLPHLGKRNRILRKGDPTFTPGSTS